MKLNRIFLVAIYFSLLCHFSQASESSDINMTLKKLPKLSVDSYRNELLEIQKLQRDNEKLKLEEQKILIRDKLNKLRKDNINSTKIISIYSSASKRYAQLYNPYDGIVTVSAGNILMKRYQVIKITSTHLILENINNRTEKIEIGLATPGTID
ncbi:hypothetical protein DV589_18475 [Salmonella enterica]|nr:hypothetical protein [Salmonella enterica]ECG5801078.1 hypothetical protein [Salmonella enterica subsp. enterica serovar Muenchen]EDU9608039.1 hypothetical protein [Salmonella enterica subsp. enterica serovar Sandiego]ECQ3651786.1 hypothetical protein [Salmonella enterica]EDV4825278.1 hypothetical protein [Salmonella enterica]